MELTNTLPVMHILQKVKLIVHFFFMHKPTVEFVVF